MQHYFLVLAGKYLRVCGEGIIEEQDAPATGNTSACAEKSPDIARCRGILWKYLRVCGEEDYFRLERGR